MKKLFFILSLFLFIVVSVQAEGIEDNKNTVYLDLNDNKPEVVKKNNTKTSVKETSEETDIKENILSGSVHTESPDIRQKEQETLLYEDVARKRPEKKSVSKSLEKEVIKDTSVGATYSTTEKSGQLQDSVSVYSKYQKEHFGITASYSQDGDKLKKQGAAGGTVSVAPEISINKHIKFKNVYSDNMSSNQQKNEFVMSLRPFKDDRFDLDIGAGEVFSNGNQPAQSQINLGTKFRF